ncbi:hypothetical protein KPL74_18745 [Bacillus sp. NP157]|nr:hypothetical protein KPL74_18745 [Bacillus sp. NP157]
MKKLMMAIAVAGLFAAGTAQALPGEVTAYYYYSGTQLVGQSLLYCNNVTQHWGDAPANGFQNAVAVTYACTSGKATDVAFPANVDPWVRTNFCSTQGSACTVGPWPSAGVNMLPGRYSN